MNDSIPALKRGPEKWLVGQNEEYYTDHAETRDDAILIGKSDYDDGFHIVCARVDPVDVAGHFDLNSLIERIDESGDYCSHNGGQDTIFEQCSQTQLDDLETRIRLAIREWQVELQNHGVEIKGDLFTTQYGAEYFAAAAS